MKNGTKSKLTHELRVYIQNFIFLAVFLSVFAIYRRLMLAHYGVHLDDYGISVIKALILAKLIMIGDLLHIGRKMEGKPLIFSVLLKSFAFTLWVLLFDLLEAFVRGFIQAGAFGKAVESVVAHVDYVLIGGLLIVYCAFLPFFAFRELGNVLGQEKLQQLFFTKRRT